MNTAANNVLIVLAAEDFEEHEYLTVKNVLQKYGCKIFITSDAHSLCIGSHGHKVRPDVLFFNIHQQNFAAVVFIGGNGIRKYWNNSALHKIVRAFYSANKIVAAICSAPVILAKAGILSEANVTCFEKDKFEIEKSGLKYSEDNLAVCNNVITAQSPSEALDFANLVAHHISEIKVS
jgi:protease I